MKKYVNNSFITKSPSEYKNGTAAVTNLPVTIYTDGQPVSSYTLKGNTSVSGTPSPQNPVTIEGVGEETANSFNINGTWTKQNPSDTVTVSGNSVTITSAYFAYQVITVEPNTDYTLSYSSEGNYTLVRGYNSSTFSSANQIFSANRSPVSFNTGNTETLYILFYSGTGTTGTTTYSNIMLSEGAAIPFEPYGKYKISILKDLQALTPIYLSQPLMKYETDEDTLDSSGTVTRKLLKYVFTGEENILIYTSSFTGIGFQLNFSNMLSNSRTKGYCTHFKPIFTPSGSGVDGITFGASNTMIYCTFSAESVTEYNLTDITSIKQWLKNQYDAGTPVTIYYVRATPTTESVTVPEIATTGGEVTIDVDTTVKPSEVDLTYHGWHTHEPLKRENGAWV